MLEFPSPVCNNAWMLIAWLQGQFACVGKWGSIVSLRMLPDEQRTSIGPIPDGQDTQEPKISGASRFTVGTRQSTGDFLKCIRFEFLSFVGEAR